MHPSHAFVRAPTRRLRELEDTTKPALHTFRAVCDGLALRTAQRRRHEGHAAVRVAAEQRQIGRLERQAAPVGLDEDGPASISACMPTTCASVLLFLHPYPWVNSPPRAHAQRHQNKSLLYQNTDFRSSSISIALQSACGCWACPCEGLDTPRTGELE